MSYHWNQNIATGNTSSQYKYNQSSLESSRNSLSNLSWSNSKKNQLEPALPGIPDLICLSHLRWDFVYQRPQHLLSRCVQERRVFFVEEPIFTDDPQAWVEIDQRDCGVWVVVPHLPAGLDETQTVALQQILLDDLISECNIQDFIFWYYTPMALPFSEHQQPSLVIYDCMDELSAFKGAPPILRQREAQLFQWADLVFTGGQSLYEAKCKQHDQVYAFPSSIDAAHFAQARQATIEPPDQASIPHPRMGFFGVIDERMNLELLDQIAQIRPDWQFVILGPVVKIDPEMLPKHANIHYLGGKSYQELPQYVAGWDVALLPFALNESTRFISPTKTPEYLAAGKPVVSTSIRDVVRPYGDQKLVHIADTPADFVVAIEQAMQQTRKDNDWLQQVDAFLDQNSWDLTWSRMSDLISKAISQKINAQQTLKQQQFPITSNV